MSRPVTRPPARGIGYWFGILCILAGVAMLGWVAWQFFGTNVVAHRAQHQIVDRTERMWREPAVTVAGEKKARDELGTASALIRIPRFGDDYVVPVQEGVSDPVLAEGYGHFTGSAKPGAKGNYALAAHRVTHGEPLRRMPDLRPGDQVIVETRTTTYTYVLDTNPNDLVVPFTGTWVVEPLPHNPHAGGVQPAQREGQRLITLTTCSELFHTDNRMIAFGHLVSSKPR